MFDALKSLDLDALPAGVRKAVLAAQEQISALTESNASILERSAALATQNAELEAVNSRLEHMVKELNHLLYGPKSERFTEDERQLAFEDLEVATAEAQAQSDTIEMTTPRKKRRPPHRNLGNLPDHLERIEQVVEPDSITCPCGCGDMVKIGEDRSERLDIVPAQFRVLVTVRPNYACPNKDGGVAQAPAPIHLIEGGLPTEALIAYVGVCKYGDHSPLYRQTQIYARSGLNLDRATLASWMGKMSFHLAPVVDHMFKDLKKSDKLFADETRCPVLDPGRGRTKTGYLWAIARDERPFGGTAPPGVVFCYADGRGGKHATDFLAGFSGTLQVDGYAGYNALAKPERKGGPVKLAYCWAHARRKLKEVHDRDGSPIAAEGLKRIKAFYKIEKDIRGKTAAERRAIRQEKIKPLMADFEDWLATVRARISRKSRLGEKISYIAKHMEGLKLFLDDGTIEMDSNTVERTIRPIALNRKNALFAGHDEGGRTWGRIASLIETCKLNGVEPYAYLKATLEAIAAGHPASRIDELMPWKLTVATAVGGACALGFDRHSEILLVVSSNGQSVFDCTSGERIYRNRDDRGYEDQKLEGRRLDDLNAPPFLMSGANGGGLLNSTSDGWHIDTLQLEWPRTFCILQPPNASIYFLQEKWREYKKDASYQLVKSGFGLPVAFGFSWSGKTLVWCDRSDLFVWTRPNAKEE